MSPSHPDHLRSAESHFAFGRNWASYAKLIGEAEIAEARNGLLKLVPQSEWTGRSLLDIGCGSGLHALAASTLGVARIQAVDIDADSVATTTATLTGHGLTIPWRADAISVFDLDPMRLDRFDIVYSWGVLHHTGDMWAAIDKAAAMVAPNGLLVLALYRRTRMDRFWTAEKRWYAHASPRAQAIMRSLYTAAYAVAMNLRGRSYRNYVATYRSSRGMDFHHDVHDWLGGYPYETALAPEIESHLAALGFRPERVLARPLGNGLFGSGCDEYVYRAPA